MRIEAVRASTCPRCSGRLRERDGSRKWQRHFECESCWTVYELYVERHREPCAPDPQRYFLRHAITLQMGRTRRGSR